MKSIDYFSAGLPIINNIGGDTSEIVKKYNCGINYILFNNISNYIINDNSKMRESTDKAFLDLFSMESTIKKIKEILSNI